MRQLFDYQQDVKAGVYEAWARGDRFPLAVMPTGAGKTVTFCDIVREHRGLSAIIVHRRELVAQISLSLAAQDTYHRVLAPANVARWINGLHVEEFGRSFMSQTAEASVVGVDTLNSWAKTPGRLDDWFKQVTLWVMDEAHHIVVGNKWYKAVIRFVNAKGLGVTATVPRADGKGLGRHADGLFYCLVEGPGMRNLINRGRLCDYDIALPESDLDLAGLTVTASGDYNPKKLRERVQSSHIIGDMVEQYARLARGKLAVCFVESIATAHDVGAAFNAAGIPAAVVSSKTDDATRVATVRRFARRELHVLINVDLFGEGYDLPAIEVVIMGRATQSYGLYVQQFGRALRVMEGKEKALIIDHVGNVLRHNLPDAPRAWSLDAREKRSRKKFDPDEIPLKRCTACTRPYEAIYPACPYCGAVPKVTARSTPEQVDGDLSLLDPLTLAKMRGEVDRINEDPDSVMRRVHAAAGGPAAMRAARLHRERQAAQETLRHAMAWWGGFQNKQERCQQESQRRFFHRYGVDVLGAQTLGTEDARKLTELLIIDLQRGKV